MKKVWTRSVFKMLQNDNTFTGSNVIPMEFTKEELEDVEETEVQEESTEVDGKPKKVKLAPKIPLIKATGKIIASLKDKGADKESIKEYMDNKRRSVGKKDKDKMK